ncbi:hypothetical protein Lesp02_43110 [Lentzea sp. NBRC 105346]|nr:hypothetical protein [Lentzea sp. NBRC 105346]GLZ32123.1 hypothetical protein Lesp02_43110 [Lentzea sp. NBRC 105346]
MIVNTIARIAAAVILISSALFLAAGPASADPQEVFTPPYVVAP